MKEAGMSKRELEFTTRLTREDVAGLIEALIEGLKDGHLKVQKSSEVLELEVPRVVDLKIEAEIDEERAEFEIEVSWLTNRAGEPDDVPEESTDNVSSVAPKARASGAKKAGSSSKTPTAKPRSSSAGSGKKSAAGAVAQKRTAKTAKSGKTAGTGVKTGKAAGASTKKDKPE